ncbi:hypothetical protein [Micromonospora okii]|nr:hypothetical protein [Micromonospora okii]
MLASNVGTWMQTVGAQWLLVDEPNAPAGCPRRCCSPSPSASASGRR